MTGERVDITPEQSSSAEAILRWVIYAEFDPPHVRIEAARRMYEAAPARSAEHEQNLRDLKQIKEDPGWALTAVQEWRRLQAENERLREERKQYKAGLQRLASKEAFTGALDVHYADTAILWAEMQARGRFAEDVLSWRVLADSGEGE